MLVYLTKQMARLSDAVFGRTDPSQLAWAVAFGVLLGLVPHGNLLAIALLILVLTLHVNHGLAAAVAVATAFLAAKIDPFSHRVGYYVLTHEDFSRHLATAWQWPFIPWTDINNTVVLGSFVIGSLALVPLFLLTYPLFHLLVSKNPPGDDRPRSGAEAALELSVGATASKPIARPQQAAVKPQATPAVLPLEPTAIDAAMNGLMKTPTSTVAPEPQVIETRIDVIRMTNRKDAEDGTKVEAQDISEQDAPMSEALNYLLRQLSDSRNRRAA